MSLENQFDSLVKEFLERDVPSFVIEEVLDKLVEDLRHHLTRHALADMSTSPGTKDSALADMNVMLDQFRQGVKNLYEEGIAGWRESRSHAD